MNESDWYDRVWFYRCCRKFVFQDKKINANEKELEKCMNRANKQIHSFFAYANRNITLNQLLTFTTIDFIISTLFFRIHIEPYST